MTVKKLTEEGRVERHAAANAILESQRVAREADPDFIKIRDWLKTGFEDKFDLLCDFAAEAVVEQGRLAKKYEALVRRVDDVQNMADILSPDARLPVHIQSKFAEVMQGIDDGNPVAQAFSSGRAVAKQMQASAGARKRHEETRQMKADVFSWCAREFHKFSSMDSAAEAVAGKEVPMKFRTVRGWIAEWKKVQQSAGTA